VLEEFCLVLCYHQDSSEEGLGLAEYSHQCWLDFLTPPKALENFSQPLEPPAVIDEGRSAFVLLACEASCAMKVTPSMSVPTWVAARHLQWCLFPTVYFGLKR
jgi:hypothetical protein